MVNQPDNMTLPLPLEGPVWQARSREEILQDINALRRMHRRGDIGGEIMPEDAHPPFPTGSAGCYHYFTLPMALNYQRDSYALWRSATLTYDDPTTKAVFDPAAVVRMGKDDLRGLLTRHKVALQPQRHVSTWYTLCSTLCTLFDGDVRRIFQKAENDIGIILRLVQQDYKIHFPYLSGPKICNYWLFVMSQYSDAQLMNKHLLSIAPDTHVIQASIKLGLVSPDIRDSTQAQARVVEAWSQVLDGTDLQPIDVHTPLWLWSRSKFVSIVHDV